MIHLGVGAFLVTCALLFLAATLVPRESDAPPGFSVNPVASAQADGSHLSTIDTSNNDAWIPFSLELGRIVPDGPAADLYLRRQMMKAPYGALHQSALTLDAPLPASPEWVQDIVVDEVERSPVLSQWYEYSYFSHLLTSRNDTYAVQLASGGSAMLQVVSYYCETETSGCMTLKFRVHAAL